MLIRQPSDILPSEITPKSVFLNRREFMAASAGALLLASEASASLKGVPSRFSTKDTPSSLKEITTYNNYYEFGTDKSDPAENAGKFKTKPWQIVVEGEAGKPRTYSLDDLLKVAALEERIYRLRCVEGWSMVIPWVGIPLASLLKQVEPNSRAKFVSFETLKDPKQMPGQLSRVLDWPYREGLRIDEAMHPLTILAVGLYGEVLPNQNGAPVRLVVPWKYGFKSIKAVVKIRLQESQPATSWNLTAPSEYGFYSNVNPAVDHPRWSQAKERRIGEILKRATLPFNGYADQVASLYAGMDLRKNF
ncbi:protein-methionine-sulfoxide reductase catalytic subunit MsrP [Deefgea tanakiae]|uniref:Protein-methionine-sulfoxide reductase catalytic subunit MsrP n=1 Tax=Deefgea tanakiae TaxID=2865840 RepID=A0ABX8Z979_9NEIS|nr:protein-methionine-sulfoxide reductase catalytic subunit MsrP [Deefgea tanakiae]QZA79121.1 protein-methionine-sulfoxide reductase catalytic subunit MsrP [Deefgea tanakiae]